ncbi:nucleobase-ascorbate transporter 4 isoform X1 [Jatropha curcas]|uniref:nucleobase-ascorbate transporter 4 isoform X1 n=3 Tax=Jatropha curcas TaxID=180498 RepID=UPI001892E1A5|nr:nucleobase-ascorbate transporter 4 isoform X1 [Jatropha curcas]
MCAPKLKSLEKAETIQSALFMTGINTLLQIWFGSRLPVVMQISEAFTIPAINIALSTKNTCSCSVNPRQRFKRTMRRIQGASIIVSFVQLTKCIEIGVPALVLLVFSRQFLSRFWKSGTKIAERYSATNSIIIVWILAEILTAAGAYDNTSQQTQLNCRANRGGLIRAAPWIKIPRPFQWGYPTFEAGDVFSTMAACFVAIIESSSTFATSSRFSGAHRIPAPRISEAIGVQGIGTLLDAVFGLGLGSTASVQHAGLVGSTQIGTRRIAIISAIFMILISLIGKLAVVLASIPLPIVGALYIAFFPYVVAGGLDDFILCDLKSFRSKSILGFSVFMGLSVPQYFSNYDLFSTDGLPQTSSNWFKIIMVVILSSPPTVGTIIAFLFYFTPKPPPPPPPPPPSPPPPPKKEDLKEGPPKPKASEPLDKAKPLPHVPPPVKSKEMKAEDETEEMKKQIRLEIKKTYKRPSSLSDLFS